MQTVAAISDGTQSAFDQVRKKVLEVFPESDAELRPSSFGDDGGMIVIRTNEEGYNDRYDFLISIRELATLFRERGIKFGFDVVIG